MGRVRPGRFRLVVGILSDSHGDAAATERALELLESNGAARYFHCGDICGDAVLDALAGRPVHFVWGNCDAPSPLLRSYVASLGLTWPEQVPVCVTVAGKSIALFHGHERAFRDAVSAADCDYIFHGHTHEFADRRVGRCRIINPGALYRARPRTCTTLDLASDELTILRIDTGEPVRRSI